MRILTSKEVREAEQQAISRPEISTILLMHRAGYATAQFCLSNFKFSSVCAVCGKGNNGGDGMVAAEALRQAGNQVSVIILAGDVNELSADASAMRSRLNLEPIWVARESDFETDAVRAALSADLILDAVVGAGFKPPLCGLARRAVDAINDAFGTVVSLDLPSGLEPDLARAASEGEQNMVFAHGIVTFVAPRPAHVFGELTSGPIAVSEIGVPPVFVPNQTALNVITAQEVGMAFPRRKRDANKRQFGHVLVIAGSLGKAGAAGLAGIAALTTGAGLVTVACPRSIHATVAGFAPELMTEGLPETDERSIAMTALGKVEQLLEGKTAVVLGPGLSRNPQTQEFVRALVSSCTLPLVLDADGLHAFDGRYDELKTAERSERYRVLTPHPGEAARLLGVPIETIQGDRVAIAKRIAVDTGSCVVLKGSQTIVAGFSDETWINMTGNPALAKGGSGDVLSGMIGAALARRGAGIKPARPAGAPASEGASPLAETESEMHAQMKQYQERRLKLNSAQIAAFLNDVRVAAAVHLHGLAGDLARDHLHENIVLATHLPQQLGAAFRVCELETARSLFCLQR
jgi:NAD(P)H-hydrate epimerase